MTKRPGTKNKSFLFLRGLNAIMRRRNFIQESELKIYENGIIFHRAIYHIQLWSDDRCGNPGMHRYGHVPGKETRSDERRRSSDHRHYRILSGFIGAKLLYVIVEFDQFIEDPMSVMAEKALWSMEGSL